jgi:hypothetical protein
MSGFEPDPIQYAFAFITYHLQCISGGAFLLSGCATDLIQSHTNFTLIVPPSITLFQVVHCAAPSVDLQA